MFGFLCYVLFICNFMKIKISILFSLTLIFACDLKDKQGNSSHTTTTTLIEHDKRKIFIDSSENKKEYWNGIFQFMRIYYPTIDISQFNNQRLQTTYALEEEFFNINSSDSFRKVIRLIVLPSFSNPYSIKVELKNNKTYLTTKLLDKNDSGTKRFL